MASENDGGKRQPPSDDRTLLDPLSNEELKALREARQRMQAKRKEQEGGGSSVIKHQVVIGPSASPEDGDAPTRAMPTLPTFDGEVTLDKLNLGPKPAPPKVTPARAAPSPDAEAPPRQPPARPPSRPASERRRPPEATTQPGADEGLQAPVEPATKAGPTGFGENTMMWMQPAKAPLGAASTAPTSTSLPLPTPKQKGAAWAQSIGALVLLLAVAGVVAFIFWPQPRGSLELYTTPPGATLFIDGSPREEPTPVKLTLLAGTHALRVEKEGYEPATVTVEVTENQEARRDVDLVPISQPGLQTVGLSIEPVAADVVFDGTRHGRVRSLQLPNIDPNREHVIRIEAPGFLKTEQRIPAGKLQSSYSFTLEPDEE